MNYFKDCTSIEEVKKLYKSLAKIHHPDKGGDVEIMKQINKEYDFVSARIINGQNFTTEEKSTAFNESKLYQETISKIAHLEGLIIEIVGNWIWVTGATRHHKDILKENGFFWASKKCAWYFRSDEFKSGSRKNIPLEEIRAKYGSKAFYTKSNLVSA